MKVITYVESTWDESRGRYVTLPGSERSYEYEGPVARCDLGGGSTTTTTTNVPAKTPTELAVDELTLKQLQRQEETSAKTQPLLDQYIADYTQQQAANKAAGLTPEAQAAATVKSQQQASQLSDIQMELARTNLEAVKNAGKATPEQIAAIDAATGAAQKTGEADIERFRTATLRQINEEVASASGLRPTDTPILRLSERAGEEAARQQGILTSKLAETNATARLNFPLASTKLVSDISSTQQGLSEAANQFSQQLAMRAQDNRYRLFAGGSAGNISPISYGSSLAQQRLGLASRTSDTSTDLGLAGIGQAAGGIGGLMRGAAMFA